MILAKTLLFTPLSVVLLYEEPILAKRFGETYRAYRARVPRWIPRLKSRAA